MLGSDCPFFIENTPKYVSGIGEKMDEVNLDLKSYEFKFFSQMYLFQLKKLTQALNQKNL